MALLKQELTNRGVQGGLPNPPNEDTTIQDLDPIALLEIQAAFGQLLMEHRKLTTFVNNLGPVLFATVLFTCMEDYQVDPNDLDSVIPTKDVFAAEAAAIGMIRSVASAFGTLYGDVAVEPSDQEIDADTDICPVLSTAPV